MRRAPAPSRCQPRGDRSSPPWASTGRAAGPPPGPRAGEQEAEPAGGRQSGRAGGRAHLSPTSAALTRRAPRTRPRADPARQPRVAPDVRVKPSAPAGRGGEENGEISAGLSGSGSGPAGLRSPAVAGQGRSVASPQLRPGAGSLLGAECLLSGAWIWIAAAAAAAPGPLLFTRFPNTLPTRRSGTVLGW